MSSSAETLMDEAREPPQGVQERFQGSPQGSMHEAQCLATSPAGAGDKVGQGSPYTYQLQRRAAEASLHSCPHHHSLLSPPRGHRHPAATVRAQGRTLKNGGSVWGVYGGRVWGTDLSFPPGMSPRPIIPKQSGNQNFRTTGNPQGSKFLESLPLFFWPWTKLLNYGDL